ncbi:sensor domain-containing diguanylate cyclase [Dasania sp. GY-MA-18]|uniref:Sensor domain-containing diguanylate cyclase n=1 Tax=Dasania phycosphaerae TaxID=2950436 RepID=A0A9J6RLI3_9GAMM|nr:MULTISPECIES: sensor domain-containing diguanylate cyclase [Dasania]MCR8922932.1 sensor domain-containing diguanylate cyclase [Dasania sp. GY-MA-18]MCZ0865363.1 sensor domain-containing diguanylate cyclase [Dasania phycosphaerae]MCZ0869088.1 sensor domain-containing diguanylate cyclase [Dasania phycosphaerae]
MATTSFALGIAATVLISQRKTQRQRASQPSTTDSQLKKEELERNRRAHYFAQVGTWDWEIHADRLHWSDEIYAMFGYKVGEFTPSYQKFIDALHPDDVSSVQSAEQACMKGDKHYEIEYRVVHPDGSIRWLYESGDVLFDDNGKPERFTGIVRDITRSKKANDRFREMAHYDSLTSLPNRELFNQRINDAIARSKQQSKTLALVFMDLNQFKPINDQHGHSTGDKVLQALGQRLKCSTRSIDTVARVGGDEFVAILENVNKEEALKIVENLRALFLQPIAIGPQLFTLGVSIGISLCPDDASDADSLIHIADMAMYQAKKSGSNQIRFGQTKN